MKLQRRFLLRDEQNGSPFGDLHDGGRVKSLNKCDTSTTLRCFLLRRVPFAFRIVRVGHIRPYFALARKIASHVNESLISSRFENDRKFTGSHFSTAHYRFVLLIFFNFYQTRHGHKDSENKIPQDVCRRSNIEKGFAYGRIATWKISEHHAEWKYTKFVEVWNFIQVAQAIRSIYLRLYNLTEIKVINLK